MKKLILLIITLSVAKASFCQVPSKQTLDSAQYQIILATVEFIASDTIYGSNNPPCNDCVLGDYEILNKYAKTQKLTGVPGLVDEWKIVLLDTTVAGWLSSIEGFSKRVHDKIASGDKKRRQKLRGYNKYKGKLDDIVNGLKPIEKPQTSLGQEPMMGSGETDESQKEDAEDEKVSVVSSLLTWQGFNIVGCIIVFSIVLIIIIRRNKKKIGSLTSEIEKLREKRKNETTSLKREKEVLEAEKKRIEDTVDHLEIELKNEREKNNLSKQQLVVEEQKVNTSPKVESKIKYASYADQGDGFSIGSLLSQSNNEAIFEINIASSNTASYKISNNSTVQRYALSNAAFFLGATCKYDTEPNSQQSIVTEKAGELKLQGNKWLITAPAIISFR